MNKIENIIASFRGDDNRRWNLIERVTCQMRLPRLRLAMTMSTFALTMLLSTTLASESRADNEPKILPSSGGCGNGCLYEITTDSVTGKQNLRVYNDPNYTGTTKTIAGNAFKGSENNTNDNYQEYYSNATFDKITIDGDFDTIGIYAFWRNGASEVEFKGNIKTIGYGAFEFNNLTSVNLPEGLKTIDGEAFYKNNISSVTIPDSVTSIGSFAFDKLDNDMKTVYMSDALDSLGTNWPFGIYSNLSIICKGDVEKCQSLVKKYRLSNGNIVDLSDHVIAADKSQCTGEKYFWNGESCSRKESYCDKNMYYTGFECLMRPTDSADIVCDYDYSGYVKVGDNCLSPENSYAKKHYTPAEANKWLKDDDNTITITFKHK